MGFWPQVLGLTVCAQVFLRRITSLVEDLLTPITTAPATWPTVGFAGDAGGAAAFAQALQDFQAFALVGVRPALDLGCGAHAAHTTPRFGIKGADTDAGRGDIDQDQPQLTGASAAFSRDHDYAQDRSFQPAPLAVRRPDDVLARQGSPHCLTLHAGARKARS